MKASKPKPLMRISGGNPNGFPDFVPLAAEGQKFCGACSATKSISEFGINRARRDGRQSYCGPCLRAFVRDRKYHRLDQYRAAAAEYRSRNRDRAREQARIRKQASPRDCLGRSLIHALRRMPTENPVTINQLVAIYDRQDGRCALSGIKMVWAQGEITPFTMSVDRINPSIGYTEDNVRLLCHCVNSFKLTMSDAEMLDVARAILGRSA